jgi:hypothetical protein
LERAPGEDGRADTVTLNSESTDVSERGAIPSERCHPQRAPVTPSERSHPERSEGSACS